MCYLKGGENNLDFDGMFSYPQKGTKLTSDNKYYKLMTYPSFGTSTADDRETFLGTELTVSVDVSEDLVDDSNELKKAAILPHMELLTNLHQRKSSIKC